MTTDPDQIRTHIAALLADLPDPAAALDAGGVRITDGSELAGADIEMVAARLEEAHDVLKRALESVEKGPAAGMAVPTEHR
jgi:hypothetical protein